MRLLLTSLVAAGLMTSPLSAAECLRSNDVTALDVTGLKTQLMVTALTCKANDRYNAFIQKYQPELVREDKSLSAYFSRSFGRSAVKQKDDYITRLANSQSQLGLKSGTLFCDRNLGTFDEVMALRAKDALPDYAAGRTVAQPINALTCGPDIPSEKPAKKANSTKQRRRSQR